MGKYLHGSIRHRIMMIFMGLTAVMMLAIWAINNWWLEKYYIDQKRKEMEQAYDEIDAAVMEKSQAGEIISEVIKREIQQEWEAWSNSAGQELSLIHI